MTDPDVIEPVQPDAVVESAPEPDLRDTIREAIRSQREPSDEAAPKPEATGEAAEATAAERKDGRDEQGRFAPKVGETAKVDEAKPAIDPAKVEDTEKVADPMAPAIRPPPGWSPASKAEFEKLPPHVQADIAKREHEVNQGFAKLAEYKELEPLAALAKQNGTTLPAAVNNYRQFEVQLQKDFLGGVDLICQRFGVDPARLAQAISARQQGKPPGQAPPAQPQRTTPQIDPNALVQQARDAMRAEMERDQINNSIKAFADDPKNMYFENVRGTMAKLMQSGLASTLEEAYGKSCALTPEVAALINQRAATSAAPAQTQRAAVDQARAAAKATTGAPSFGIKAGSQPNSNLSLRETIVAARAAQVGRA